MKRALDAILDQTWALERSVLDRLAAYIRGELTIEAAAPSQPTQTRNQGVVAVIPIHGVIDRRSSWLSELFGGTSVETIRNDLRAAIADSEVRGIVLDIDSPGGTVSGIQELAAEIRKARDQKPVLALANDVAASAAYWLAAQAGEFMVTPSGQVGSIGVYAVHFDMSGAYEQAGINVSIISAGEKKTEGNEFEPLSDDARASIQKRVDAYYDQFAADVAAGRGTTAAKVKADFGQGGMLLATEAKTAGMVDRVGTMDDALRSVSRSSRSFGAELNGPAEGEDDEPRQFRDRIAQFASDGLAIAAHAQTRAALRAKEGRPPFSEPVLAHLRSTRDALSALLPDEPAAATPAVEPPKPQAAQPPVVAVPAPAATAPRFRSTDDWMQFLESHA